MLRRVATVLVVVASAVWAAPVASAAADPDGWKGTYSTTFDEFPSGCIAFDGESDDGRAGWFRPEMVTVADGRLRLAVQRRAYNGKPFTAGELRCPGTAQQYGRYEFRARVPVGAGIVSQVLLHPVDDAATNAVSLLELTARPGAQKAEVHNGSGKNTSVKSFGGSFSEWHNYDIEWAPTGFRVFVDDKLQSVDPAVSDVHRWLGFAVTTGGSAATPGAGTALPATFEIEFLRVYSFAPNPSATAPDPRPSTLDNGLGGQTHQDSRWSWWLATAATIMALVALFVLIVHKTRSRRPPSSHRA